MTEPEPLLTLRQAADRLGVGKWIIRKLIRGGELRAFKVRTAIRISPLDLRHYLQRRELAAGESIYPNRRAVADRV